MDRISKTAYDQNDRITQSNIDNLKNYIQVLLDTAKEY